MNGRRSLTTLGLSLGLHALLILAIGFSLNQPTRIIQHIEVDLGQTGAAKNPEKEPAAPTAPAPIPEPPKPEPEPSPEPVPKPVVKQPVQKPKPRPKKEQPVVEKIEATEQVNAKKIKTAPDTSQKKATDSKLAGSTNTPAADNARSGGQTTDASVLQAWLAAIRARIESAKRYPMMAERRRIQGEVVMSFRISFDGLLLEDPKLIKSSGFSLLDNAALRAVKRAAPFPRFPGPADEMLTEPLSVELDFVIR